MHRNILVTGGTGFIGSHLVRALSLRGDKVRVLDNDSRGSRNNIGDLVNKIELCFGDIRNPETVRSAMKGIHTVCHLAAINGTENFYKYPNDVLEVAIKGAINVVDACRAEGVKEILFFSTSEVYHNPPRLPADEKVPLLIPDNMNPRYSYSAGKIASEMLLLHSHHFDKVRIIRPHNIYGPAMGHAHVIPQFILRLNDLVKHYPHGNIPFKIQGTGQETRAFLYISDLTAGTLKVMDEAPPITVVHLGSEEEISIEQLAFKIAEFFGRSLLIVPGKLAEGSPSRRCPDIALAKTFGFSPRIRLEEGIRKTIGWYLSHSSQPLEKKRSGGYR